MTATPLLTAAEVAGQLRLSRPTVYALAQRRELASIRFGGQWHFTQADVDAYLTSHRREARGAAAETAAENVTAIGEFKSGPPNRRARARTA